MSKAVAVCVGECTKHATHVSFVELGSPATMKDISDGYHTFGDLYMHRLALTVALTAAAPADVSWRSWYHHDSDGPMFDDSFIVGMDLPSGTITYHYNAQFWDAFEHVITLPYAPKWDGASPEDSIVRLRNLPAHLVAED